MKLCTVIIINQHIWWKAELLRYLRFPPLSFWYFTKLDHTRSSFDWFVLLLEDSLGAEALALVLRIWCSKGCSFPLKAANPTLSRSQAVSSRYDRCLRSSKSCSCLRREIHSWECNWKLWEYEADTAAMLVDKTSSPADKEVQGSLKWKYRIYCRMEFKARIFNPTWT